MATITSSSVRRTYDLLRSSFLRGDVAGDEPLSEDDLTNALSATSGVVRAAMQLLAGEGVVRTDAGAVVSPLEPTFLPLTSLLTPSAKATRYRVSRRSLGASIMTAPALVSRWLGLAPGASVALLEALVLRDDVPIGVTAGYVRIPPEIEIAVADQRDVIGFLVDRLRVCVGEAESTVAAVAADEQTARLLGVPVGSPMLWLEDYVRDADGVPCAVSQLRYRGDRVAFCTD